MSDHESPNTKVFKLNPKFLSTASDIAIAVTPPAGGELAAALATNQPFPDRQIELGNISIRAETGKDIEFLSPKGAVRFSGQGGAFAGLGVFQDPAKMLDTLRRDPDGTSIVAELELEKDEIHNYVLLRWGYDIEAAAKGSVALGVGGSVKFGVTGRRDGLYAVVRRLDKTLGAASAVTETISSWALPSLVDSADALKPGSWLIAEVDGSLALSLAAQYGYDFNWVREAVQADGLTGDIGLRIQLGVTASLGFQASGQYAVILGRESLKPEDRCLRLRLCKLSKKGWEFAFTAGAEVELDFDKLLPGKFDDFIAGVFGVHGLQVLKDLDKWTDPNEQLSSLLSEVGIDYAQKLLHDATGIDPKTEFETAKARLQDLLKKWRALPHRVASILWTIVDQKQNLAPLRDFLGRPPAFWTALLSNEL
jgi:hypothetical protein